jgi:hypothetical protein
VFERKFLAYLLYSTLLEFRDAAYKSNDSRVYHLADMLHNVPFSILDDESAKLEYDNLLKQVDQLKVPEWLENRIIEFRNQFGDLES